MGTRLLLIYAPVQLADVADVAQPAQLSLEVREVCLLRPLLGLLVLLWEGHQLCR